MNRQSGTQRQRASDSAQFASPGTEGDASIAGEGLIAVGVEPACIVEIGGPVEDHAAAIDLHEGTAAGRQIQCAVDGHSIQAITAVIDHAQHTGALLRSTGNLTAIEQNNAARLRIECAVVGEGIVDVKLAAVL